MKVDVQACFDTIEQRELLRIIDKLISEVLYLTRIGYHTPLLELQDVYMIQRYGQVGMSAGRPRRTFVRQATDGMSFHSFLLGYGKCTLSEDPPHFLQYAVELAQSLRSIIFADEVKVRYRRIS